MPGEKGTLEMHFTPEQAETLEIALARGVKFHHPVLEHEKALLEHVRAKIAEHQVK